MAGRQNDKANRLVHATITCDYTLWVAITLVNSNKFTAIALLAIEVLVHMKKGYRIIERNNKIGIDEL